MEDAADAFHGVKQLAKKDEGEEGEEEEEEGEGGEEDSEWLSTVKAIHSKKPVVLQNAVFAREITWKGRMDININIVIVIVTYKERNVQVFL